MIDLAAITQDELIQRIKAELESRPHNPSYSHFDLAPSLTPPAAYVLILGAGFSYGVVPLVNELMQQTIGAYFYPDQSQWGKRPESVLQRDSARFWLEFNKAAARDKLPIVEVDSRGLPENSGAAYQRLFLYEGANALFTQLKPKSRSKNYLNLLREQREKSQPPKEQGEQRPNRGEKFVQGFLRYILVPGGESGWGWTGRTELNSAHIYLAALLEAQQLGRGWKTAAFCRTLFTTNFDTLLQNALQMVNLLYCLTDRPEKGFEPSDFREEEGPIHLVYVHGSILRHNPASTIEELGGLASKNVEVLRGYLESHDVIVIGYSGWNDGLMAALRGCGSSQSRVYWCGVSPQPASHVATFLQERSGTTTYVHLREGGADALMRALYEALIPEEFQRDPFQRYRMRAQERC
jgi:hypothetical protein